MFTTGDGAIIRGDFKKASQIRSLSWTGLSIALSSHLETQDKTWSIALCRQPLSS
jgi:hypothetical protein